jgi:hypothetical protein
MLDGVEREAEELLRYRAELGRRLARTGVRDVGALLDLYAQLRAALDGVSAQEIEWARAKAVRLADEVARIGRGLDEVRRLKDRLGR